MNLGVLLSVIQDVGIRFWECQHEPVGLWLRPRADRAPRAAVPAASADPYPYPEQQGPEYPYEQDPPYAYPPEPQYQYPQEPPTQYQYPQTPPGPQYPPAQPAPDPYPQDPDYPYPYTPQPAEPERVGVPS